MTAFLPLPWFARGALLRRTREIATVLARHGLGWVLARVGLDRLVPFGRVRFAEGEAEMPAEATAERLRLAFGELGATFIKLGQALSTRPDLLPPAYVAQLEKLQDAAPPVPFEAVRQVIHEDLGAWPEDVFAEFEATPLASASIGQVHAARLRDGRSVIVKVQRPGVVAQVEQDLEILQGMAEWAGVHTAVGRDYNLPVLASEFAYTLRGELDYYREARNAERFRALFAGDPGIYIPRVIRECSRGRVLTIERVEGIKISDTAAMDAAGIDRHAVGENAVRLILREVFEFGFLHADPHPGNFFVRPDASIAVVDFGMVARIDERLRNMLLRIGLAVVHQDAERLADELYALGVIGRRVKRMALVRDLDHVLTYYGAGSIREIAATQALNEMLTLSRRYRLQLPGELAMLLRVVAISEGLGVRLDPDFRIVDFAAPYLREFLESQRAPGALARRLGDAALDATDLGLDLPRRALRLLGLLERGDLELRVSPESLHEFTRHLQRMTNRLALSLLLAVLILTMGLILAAYHPAVLEPYVGWLLGVPFVAALGLGIWWIWSIWRSGRT